MLKAESGSLLIKISLPLLGVKRYFGDRRLKMYAHLFMPTSDFDNRFMGMAHSDVSPHVLQCAKVPPLLGHKVYTQSPHSFAH